uniref:DUF3291 domain-containing protein n=1 Tax=uncultured Thiotrichaceae bacterium TaxID=298394 RepID=A0A6S6U9E7_9GAMM|nr:MAG: Unknown protein [uncultured Thiotrichaceae bacterium]
MKYHLAQINVALAKEALDSATMKGFVDRLDEINELADHSPGFVWRLQSDVRDEKTIQTLDNPLLIVNMSVWEDLASLKHYVYKSVHVELIRDREAWFNKIAEAHQALWWVPEGHLPSVEEGKAKLEYLQQNGVGPKAFNFAKPSPPPQG